MDVGRGVDSARYKAGEAEVERSPRGVGLTTGTERGQTERLSIQTSSFLTKVSGWRTTLKVHYRHLLARGCLAGLVLTPNH